MQQEQLLQVDPLSFPIDRAFIPSPRIYQQLQQFIAANCKGLPDNFHHFLTNLLQHTHSLINFTSFRKIVRVIKKYVIAAKNQPLQLALSDFLTTQAAKYFPYHIKASHVHNFQLYIDLAKNLKIRQPQKLTDQRQIILYLQCAPYNEAFLNSLLQKILDQTIVDKKSQSFKSLKLNPFFSSFIARHIDKIIPQLQRLLVRSESNIEIWQDVFVNVVDLKGMEKSLDQILKKVKNYFASYPEASLGIINAIGGAITSYQAFKEFITFVAAVVANQHNSKKKLNFLKMTEDSIKALQKFSADPNHAKQANQIANQILNVYAAGFGRFVDDDEAVVVLDLLNKILPFVKDPSDQIAKTVKSLIKNPNKNVLVYVALTLSIYSSQQIKSLPSVNQIYVYFKSQIPTLQKKAIQVWQWYVPIIAFVSKVDASNFENISESLPIYKASCISMAILQKKVLLEMLLRQYKYFLAEDEQISQHYWTVIGVLMEELKSRKEWSEVVATLSLEHKLKLLTEGIYPLLWYPSKDLKKNSSGNEFKSLVGFVIASLDQKQKLNGYKVSGMEKILILCRMTCVDWRKKIEFVYSQEDVTKFEKVQNKYWKASMFEYDSEEAILVLDSHKRLIETGAQVLLGVQVPQSFTQHISQILKPANYQKNFDYITEFELETKKELVGLLKELDSTKEMLFERSFSSQQKPKEKKVYYNPLMIDTRMMSQEEVKTEKYRKHFQKMVAYFAKYVHLFEANLIHPSFLFALWHTHFSSLISITQYAQTRLYIYKLVRKSIERTHVNMAQQAKAKNIKLQDMTMFLKYASFFGEFFSIRHSKITPSLSLMERSSGFLKTLLTVDFTSAFADHIFDKDKQFIPHFINDMCEEILQNMEFDLTIKKLAIHFYQKCQSRLLEFNNDQLLFTYILKNINILSSSQFMKPVLIRIMQQVDKSRYNQLFEDILSFVSDTKMLILTVVNDVLVKHEVDYQPGFEEYIKLRILTLETNVPEISQLSNQIIKKESTQNKDILKFNMKNFLKKNSKQTVQKLCIFIKEQMKPHQVEPIFKMFCKTFNELFNQKLDQECLETFPFFLSLNLDSIKPSLFADIFELLVLKFTANQSYVTLNKVSMEVGIEMIKHFSAKDVKYAEEILKVLEGFINRSTGVSNIVFLGVLAPFLEGNKNLVMIEKRITELFKGQKQAEQKSIAKCMPDLMSFFKQPKNLVEQIFIDLKTLPEANQLGQSYLACGLLKGIGYRQTVEYLQRLLSSEHVTKTRPQKTARIYLLTAFVQIFGRFIELQANRIVQIVIGYMADGIEEIRTVAKRVVQTLILKMSAYAVKNLLPFLLNGLETESNWRVKISYIWILGIMANCSARQLQTSLPIIVPTLSTCLSNAHPNIRNTASQALNLIGQTIKNPQISNSIDILIEALQNPFEKSYKALDILLKTRFSHFIDAPSLSIVVPITDYCLRGRNSELKAGACQVIGSIVELIMNPYDLLPYLRIIGVGLKVALCDPLPQIRAIAAMAVGKISAKIGKQNSEEYFQFVLDIIESSLSNTTERQGAAQAYSQIICAHDYEYFEESLNNIFRKLNEVKHSQKQGFILVFLYVPNIKREEFEGFIKEVNLNMYAFVADEDENIRNSAMLVEKVLINQYCLTHTDLLLDPLCEGVFETNWRKRNGALILIGELLNILKSHMYNTRTQDKAYAYYKGLMAVYILKDDDLEMPRLTANQVWNAYIQNTPKTIRTGLKELVEMWTRYTHEANGVVFKNIGEFSSKYGENYFSQILTFMDEYMKNPKLQKGVFEVLTEFIKRLQQQFMMKDQYKNKIRDFLSRNVFTCHGDVRISLARAIAIWVQKMKEEKFFEELVCPQIEKMDTRSDTDQEYTQCLHLLRDLLHTSSQKVVDRLINQIMIVPLSQFKIEVITNNADKLANQLYTQFKQPATEIFVQQIYSLVSNPEKQNRLELITYCLEQVSLKLSLKYKIEFVRMMIGHLRRIQQKQTLDDRELKIVKKLLGVVFFFLNSIEIAQLEELEILLGEITPLLFTREYNINQSVHKIFQILISDAKQQKTALYIKQMIVSMENNAVSRNVTVIWDEPTTASNYIQILVKCIAYGNSETMEEALEMMKFLMKYAKRQIIDKEILKIIGPVIRAVNYPLLMKQKLLLMDFLSSVYQKRFNIQVYSQQILSICFRLLQQFKQRDQIMTCVANEFQNLLLNSVGKNELMLAIISKIKVYGNVLVEAVYHLVKSLVNGQVELPKVTYEKAYEDFSNISINNQAKLQLRGVYYASKTAARLGVSLGVPIDKLESQLKAATCPYEVVLNYLHFSYYKKSKVPRLQCVEVFIKQSSRQKVYYLLKSLKLCRKANPQTKAIFTEKYVKELVPEGLSGFEDIIDILEEFEDQ